MNQERFSNLKVLNSHKERKAKFAPHPPPPLPPITISKEVVTGPRTLNTAPGALETNDKTKPFNILIISRLWV